MRRLTELQAKILGALEKQVEEEDVNFKRLADLFGIYPNALREHLDAIARKGYLEIKSRGRGRNPTVRLLTAGVPVVGHIAAGPSSEALKLPKGYLKLSSHPGRFGLRVGAASVPSVRSEPPLHFHYLTTVMRFRLKCSANLLNI